LPKFDRDDGGMALVMHELSQHEQGRSRLAPRGRGPCNAPGWPSEAEASRWNHCSTVSIGIFTMPAQHDRVFGADMQ
jgi:hypothetical protein